MKLCHACGLKTKSLKDGSSDPGRSHGPPVPGEHHQDVERRRQDNALGLCVVCYAPRIFMKDAISTKNNALQILHDIHQQRFLHDNLFESEPKKRLRNLKIHEKEITGGGVGEFDDGLVVLLYKDIVPEVYDEINMDGWREEAFSSIENWKSAQLALLQRRDPIVVKKINLAAEKMKEWCTPGI